METKKENLPLAVGYLRLSDDEQEGSIERQRQALVALAAGRSNIRSFVVETGRSGQGASRPPKG